MVCVCVCVCVRRTPRTGPVPTNAQDRKQQVTGSGIGSSPLDPSLVPMVPWEEELAKVGSGIK